MTVGLLAGFAGIVATARMGTASVQQGTGLELRVITAVIIGGASLQGGEGSVFGAFLGSLLMALITNSLTPVSYTHLLDKASSSTMITEYIGPPKS